MSFNLFFICHSVLIYLSSSLFLLPPSLSLFYSSFLLGFYPRASSMLDVSSATESCSQIHHTLKFLFLQAQTDLKGEACPLVLDFRILF